MAKKSPPGSLPPAVPLAITPTFRPWTHTSDDSYIYQLSLVVATATVSFIQIKRASIPPFHIARTNKRNAKPRRRKKPYARHCSCTEQFDRFTRVYESQDPRGNTYGKDIQCEARLFSSTKYRKIVVTVQIVFFRLTGEEERKQPCRHQTRVVSNW